MTLAAGVRVGSYEVGPLIGAGGMGEVYRARDTRLGRDVALKVLPEAFSLDPDRMARFRREAQVLASLNHPNIAAIYGLEESGGMTALVMELVEGPTLDERIRRPEGLRLPGDGTPDRLPGGGRGRPSGLPIGEALPIARQIADALEAAHEQSIVHRDLKPANIKVRDDGTVKVLDFGLAKALQPVSMTGPDATASPTITTPAMTGVGVILGTAAYMSPEQAKGKEADKRSDVWAFGCVLYEMLTGTRAFSGDDVADTLAAVLRAEPDWQRLPEATPPAIRRLLRRSLEKDRRQRLPDIAVARLEIAEALDSTHATDLHDAARPAPTQTAWQRARPYVQWGLVGSLALSLALVLTWWVPWQSSAPGTPLRMRVDLGAAGATLVTDIGSAAALSPNGQTLAFVAGEGAAAPRLYLRRLDQLQATPLAGTNNARSPFFSPDGQWIAFFADGKLKKVSVMGGAIVTLCDAPNARGGTWDNEDTIVFLPNTGGTGAPIGLLRVSSGGGKPEPLIERDFGTQRWPQVLPNGKAVLYTRFSPTDGPSIVVQPLPTGDRKVLRPGGGYARYLASGHLVFIEGATLFAAPFDLERLEMTSQPVPVLDGVMTSPQNMDGAQFSVSATGTAVYVPGRNADTQGMPIEWMDRAGTSPLRKMPANWSNPAFASDGRRLAMDIVDGSNLDVWIYEWGRDTLSRLTFDSANGKPVWTPDDRRIVFSSTRGEKDKQTYNLYWQRADGTGDVQRLTAEPGRAQLPASWHPSGKLLAFVQVSPQSDIMLLPLEGDEASGWKPGKPTVFLNSPAVEQEPMFSPDGRWIAYQSLESGRGEVYVRPFPGPGGKWQISTDGGGYPMWSRTRSELFYQTPDQRIMVASYTINGDSFSADRARLWSETRFMSRGRQRSVALHPDGTRFAVAAAPKAEGAERQDTLVFIFNFFEELRRVAPITKN